MCKLLDEYGWLRLEVGLHRVSIYGFYLQCDLEGGAREITILFLGRLIKVLVESC